MIDLRCDNALHMRFDPERIAVSVKCRKCSTTAGYSVYHDWPLPEIIEAYRRGEINGVCAPKEQRFVHWRVTAA